jgi:hypothetical protein
MASFALGAVQAVTSEADFDAAVKGANRAAVFFWAAWCVLWLRPSALHCNTVICACDI